jgi:2,4-diketo-3-deoxy-L-fuconate hydrolase
MPGEFGLGTFAANGSAPFPALVLGEHAIDLRPHFGPATTTDSLLEDWAASEAALADLAGAGEPAIHALDELRPLPPVRPGQILCAGANYFNHVRQIVRSTLRLENPERTGADLDAAVAAAMEQRAADEPFLFLAPPSALCGARDDVVLHGPGRCHDWELELAVVIGRGGQHISEPRAMEHVAGYTIANDITVRDAMFRPGFPMTDFVSSKCQPTFFPTGPVLVPRRFVPEPRALRITLSVNGQIMQDERVDDIMNGVERLIAYASSRTVLAPGDLILTGSPSGNAGVHGDRWLRPGDVMEGAITGLGTQRNRCVAPT